MPNEFPTVQTNMGCYDFCHPDARQVNYRFTLPADAPFPSIDYCIPEGSEYAHVTSNVYRAAETCLAYSQSCLYCGKVDDLTKLVAYLEEHWERHEVGRLEWERDQLQGKLAEIEGELAKARKQWTEMAREKVDTVAASRSQNQSCCGEEKMISSWPTAAGSRGRKRWAMESTTALGLGRPKRPSSEARLRFWAGAGPGA